MPARHAATRQPRLIPTERAESPLEALLALHLTASGIPFEREVRFAPPRRWRIDFLVAAWLAVEVEGGVWRGGKGRHTNPTGFLADIDKYNAVSLAGLVLLRFAAPHIEDGTALATIERAIQLREAHHGDHTLQTTAAPSGMGRVPSQRVPRARPVARRPRERVRDLPLGDQ